MHVFCIVCSTFIFGLKNLIIEIVYQAAKLGASLQFYFPSLMRFSFALFSFPSRFLSPLLTFSF